MLNDRRTDTGGGVCSEARLALTDKAAGSVHTHVSQITATLLLEATLINIYRRGKAQTKNRKLSVNQLVFHDRVQFCYGVVTCIDTSCYFIAVLLFYI